MSLLKKLKNKKLQTAVLSSVMALSCLVGVNNEVFAYVNPSSNNAIYTGNSTVVVGSEAEATSERTGVTAIGYKATGSNNATAIGNNSNANQNGTAVGSSSNASGTDAIAVGDRANATDTMSIAIGYNSEATAVGSIVLGARSEATAENAVSIGKDSKATYEDAIAIGANTFANATGAVAIGYGAGMPDSGVRSVAVGSYAKAYGSYSLAMGCSAYSSADYAVALGSDSIATESYTVSFGDSNEDGFTRRLVNVTAGINDTDAANVSQLISSGSYDNDTKKLTLSSNSGNDVIVDLSALSGDNPDVDEPVDLSKNDKTARVVDGFNTKVVANKVTEDKENNLEITEYQVNVEGNGAAEEGNTGLISGDTLYNELKDKADITYIDAELANKADTDLGNITDDGKGVIGNIAEEALADDLNAKANADASNVADHKAEWGAAIGTGVVEDGNGELVTGGTVYNAVKGKADITYVDNELLTKADVDLSNITEGGQTVIQNIAKGSVKLEDGTNTTVSSTENADGSISYQVNVEGNGKAEAGNTGLINGDTLYNTVNEINENITNVTEGINTELDGKANADASNVADHTAEWGEAIGTGAVEDGNGELVTGDTVYEAVKDKADKDYVDEQLSGKADADLGNLTDEGKDVIKDIAKDTVKVEDGLNTTVSSTENADGSISYQVNVEGNGKAEAGNTGLINGDTLYNTVNEINENITNVTEGINAELDGKANADASNVADHTAEWGAAIGTGKVEAGNGELVTGDTVYNAVKDKVDADFGNITEEGKDVIGDIAQEALQDDLDGKANIDASNIETDKWADKLGTGTITAGDTNLVTGDTVYDAIKDLGSNSLVTSDGNTISVGKNDSATVIDVSKHNGDGSTENRVITGVATDANDMSSAANVGYVNQSVGQLATDLNRGLSELDSRMKKGVAGAAALAALNPLDYDPENKLNFAAGVGSYKGESATALGMFYRPNENVMFSLGASIGNGENMWNAGITFNLDKPSASTSKVAMARAIKTMAAENDALEAKTAEQDAKIALLTEQVEALLATQEK